MTGPEALDHYSKALNSARLAIKRLEEAPGSQAAGVGGSSCLNGLSCAESSLKDSLQHVKALLKKPKGVSG